jgi:hypothetical protein
VGRLFLFFWAQGPDDMISPIVGFLDAEWWLQVL